MHMSIQKNQYNVHSDMNKIDMSLTSRFTILLQKYSKILPTFQELKVEIIDIVNDSNTVINEKSNKNRKYWLNTINNVCNKSFNKPNNLFIFIGNVVLAGQNIRVNQGSAIPKKNVGYIEF